MDKDFLAIAVSLLLLGGTACTSQRYFDNWPAGCDPLEVGKGITNRFIAEDKPENTNKSGVTYVHYATTSQWANSMEFARSIGDASMEKALVDMMEPFYDPERKASALPHKWHVDYSVFGAVPLEIYCLNGDKRALELGLEYADNQWREPSTDTTINRNTRVPYDDQVKYWKDGYSPQTRLWIDDMYMITFLQLQAYRATQDSKYLERTARELALYLTTLQQENGLFQHTTKAPFYWGRGNGWVAAGMAMTLKVLPKDNEYYGTIEAAYRKMMAALLEYQREDGLWGQLIDGPDSWDETSCSAMFTYAFIEGYAGGLLGKDYAKAARKAWIALCGQLEDFALKEVCVGTGGRNDRQFYLDRPRKTGNNHGQCAMMWVANALVNHPDL